MNNQWFSKIAVWLVIAMVLFTVFKQFEPRATASSGSIGYSEFLDRNRNRCVVVDSRELEHWVCAHRC